MHGDDLLRAVPKPRLLIIEKRSGRVIHAVKLQRTSSVHVDTVRRGVERNLDSAKYYVKEDL